MVISSILICCCRSIFITASILCRNSKVWDIFGSSSICIYV